jgi:hypothetical protein
VLTSLDMAASDVSRKPWRLFRRDGQPFTEAETELFGDATADDFAVASMRLRARADAAAARAADARRLAELAMPLGEMVQAAGGVMTVGTTGLRTSLRLR